MDLDDPNRTEKLTMFKEIAEYKKTAPSRKEIRKMAFGDEIDNYSEVERERDPTTPL